MSAKYLSADAREEKRDDHGPGLPASTCDHGPGLPASTCLASRGSLHLPYLYIYIRIQVIIHDLIVFYKI